MKRNPVFFRIGLMALLVLVIASGCSVMVSSQSGDITTETHSVDLGAATSARVQIEMDMGELSINSGTSKLMEGTFEYTVESNRPEINTRGDGNKVDVRINQPDEMNGLIKIDSRNRWDLQLSDSVPIDLAIYTGAGNSELNLSAVDLTNLKIETGAGNGTIDLSGSRSHDLSATIKGGVGDIVVILPSEMGVRVVIKSGIGSVDMPGFKKDGDAYINDAFGKSTETLALEIESGIGSVDLQLQ